MDRFGVALGSKEQNEGLRPQNVGMVGVSQFNAARALAGREPIEVGEGQFAVNNAFEMTEELSRSMAQRGTEIVVDGQTLVATGEYVEQMLSTTTFSNDAATIIVPDAVIDGCAPQARLPTPAIWTWTTRSTAPKATSFCTPPLRRRCRPTSSRPATVGNTVRRRGPSPS